MTLTQALTRSINTIAVQAVDRDRQRQSQARPRRASSRPRTTWASRTPLPDTPSLPIGADEVTVLDHTGAYATFPNLGKAVTPHAILEVRTGDGELVWRFDRDGPKPRQVLPPQVAHDMIKMMNKVVEEGTGRRALLDGIAAAGKTGTTNAYRDAWFMGYTGNFVCGVWFGNDDYSSTNRMTGGSLPAMTWHAIMAYAHQGIEIKAAPGHSGAARSRSRRTVAERKASRRAAAAAAADRADQARRRHAGAGRADDGRRQPRARPAARRPCPSRQAEAGRAAAPTAATRSPATLRRRARSAAN